MRSFLLRLLPILLFPISLFGQHPLQISAQQLQFGTNTELQADSLLLTITNNSSQAIQISPRVFTLLGSPAFGVSDTMFTVTGGASFNLKVYFKPSHNILNNSELLLINNSGFGHIGIDLRGQGSYSNPYYSSTQNLEGQALKVALNARLANGYNTLGYNTARNQMFGTIDNWQLNGRAAFLHYNKTECVYTGRTIENYPVNTGTLNNAPYSMNTEHTWPQSEGSDVDPMRSDLHHLFPSDGSINSSRGNKPFNWVPVPSLTYPGGSKANPVYFEPRDFHKGRVASAMLYYAVRYYNNNQVNLSYLSDQEADLREWMQLFPPDSIAIRRNNDIYASQNNRNPFVDYPQLLDRMSNLSSATSGVPVHRGLFIADTVVNMGQIANGSQRTYTVTVVNYGNQVENLNNLRLAQGRMTLVGMNSRSVAPGERIDIQLQYNSNGLPLVDTFRMETGFPALPAVTIPFRANGNDSLGAFGLLTPGNNLNQTIDGSGVQTLGFSWERAISQSGMPVQYTLLFDLPGGNFSNPLAQFPVAASDTFLALSYLALDQFLQQQAVGIGQSFSLQWTIRAYSAGFQRQATTAHNLTLVRGTVTGGISNFSLLQPGSQQAIDIQGNVNNSQLFSWQAAASSGDPAQYVVLFDRLQGDFSSPLASFTAGGQTQRQLTIAELRSFLISNQVNLGDSLSIKWTVRASSGIFQRTADSAFHLLLRRRITQADSMTAFGLQIPIYGISIPVQGDPAQQASFRWRSTITSAGVGAPLYELLIDTVGGDFSRPLIRALALGDTAVQLGYDEIADSLQARGVQAGESFAAIWTVRAFRGPLERFGNEQRPIVFTRGQITSVGVENLSTIKLYPNPVSMQQALMLEFAGKIEQLSSVDMQGKAITLQWTATGDASYHINLPVLPAGLYFLCIKTDKSLTHRIFQLVP